MNPTKDATEPTLAAGSVNAGQPAAPWIVWTEVGPNGKTQIFVDRLDPVSKDALLNVGGSLNVDPSQDADSPTITFAGNVPYVAWSEQVGNNERIFVRHLASDPQTGTWVLDTPKDGLAVDKTLDAGSPTIRPTADGRVIVMWREGDPDKQPSKIVVMH